MAINLKFDLMGNPEPPSIVLANRNGNKLGQLDVDAKSIDVKDLLETSEFTFTLNKYVDGKLTNLWDKVLDFKLVYCPEWDLWYGIKVELDEATETVKTVFCTQLGQEELSQIKVYNTEINTEADIARDDYKISILYDENDKDASILHRVMSKAPHYSIAYIDESLKRIQKSFSFDDASICDVFDEIEEEVGCLVVYNSHSDKNGMPKRDISIYDLLQNCKNPSCKHRGEFTDKCPKCGGTDIDYGYGEDTTIFVTSDELATEGIQLVTDTDSVKNCFKLEAGDDLMTATVRNCNPNGSDYIWYFSDAVKEDMSKELVEAIEGYDTKYKEYYESHISNLDANLVSQYNALVNKYEQYYNTKSTCINCKHEGYFEDECPSCHSTNILTGRSLQTVDSPIIGYPALMNAYYNTIDLALYLESGLMPSIEMSKTSAKEQLDLLTPSSLSPVAVNVENINNVSLATANSAVLSMAKVVVKPTYKVQIKTSELSADKKLWQGQFIVTNYSDENDTASNGDDEYINVTINNDTKEFIQQKIEKALNKENTDDYSISGLFEKDYDDFCAELKKYALNPLNSFYDACDACLNILVEQGVGSPNEDSDENTNEDSDLYKELYEPYYNKSVAIANEIKLREDEIAIIKGVYNEGEENDEPDTDGLQTNIIDCRNAIQEELNFEKYLGESLWLEFCAYRREDKYSNSNYVSDGLNNAELFEKANEFIEVAEQEIFKSAELQHSISATLNNLLSHPKFKHLLKHFKTGNWIRVQVDDKVYKLRLLEYNFNYGDLENIPVEFSDVTKIKNGTTDVQDIFSKAASMASSYDSVQRQAKKGNVARSTIDQWIVDGLNTANVQIQSNDSEEVLLTKNGLLARSYSDITGTYSPEQLKITHNIMAYTDDNWQTVKQSIGKHEYKYFDQSEDKLVNTTGYGMNADFANAAVLCGSQMIGGDIYSNNYSKTVVDGKTITTGSHIDLEEGNFSLAGGKLSYDGGELIIVGNIEVTTAGRIGCWDINETSIYKGSAAFGDTNGMYFGTQGLSLGNDFKVEPSGLATMTNANVSGTITGSQIIGRNSIFAGKADKNEEGYYVKDYTEDYAEITEDGKLTCTNVDILGGVLKIGRYEVLNENGEVEKDENGNTIYGWNTWIDEDGILKTNESVISGTMYAGAGSIGGFTIEPVKDENGDTVGGWLYSSGKTLGDDKSIFLSATDMSGTMSFPTYIERRDEDGNIVEDEDGDVIVDIIENPLYKEDWRITVGNNFGITKDGTAHMSNSEIIGGSLKIGAEESGYYAWISSDGVLNASGANINGTINAVNGSIAGWQIDGDKIYKDGVGMSSGDVVVNSLAENSSTSSVRIFAGCDYYSVESGRYTSIEEVLDNAGNVVGMLYKGHYDVEQQNGYVKNAEIKDVVLHTGDGTSGSVMGGQYHTFSAEVDGNRIFYTIYLDGYNKSYMEYASIQCIIQYVFVSDDIGHYKFMVLEDGSLYAKAANISGHIEATSGSFSGNIAANSGEIGGLVIVENGISSNNGGLSFNSDGKIITTNLQSDDIRAAQIKTGQISGRLTGSPSLMFENATNEYETVKAKITYNIVREGKLGITDIADEGEVKLTITTTDNNGNNKPLTASKAFNARIDYYDGFWDETNSVYYSVIIESGNDTATIIFPHMRWLNTSHNISARHKFSSVNVNPYQFSQISLTNTANITASANFIPSKDGLTLGSSTMPWEEIYSQKLLSNITTWTSDSRLKDNIINIDYDFSERLIKGLSPKSYEFKTMQGITRYGFVAQEVEKLLASLGANVNEVGIIGKPLSDKPDTENKYYSLNYIDLIAPMVNVIQKLLERVDNLETDLKLKR